jgi:hypothetical protein
MEFLHARAAAWCDTHAGSRIIIPDCCEVVKPFVHNNLSAPMASRGFCVCPHVNWAALILNGFSDADADVPVMDREQIGRRPILKVSALEEEIVMIWRS